METTTLEAVMNGDIFAQILPAYGNPRVKLPVWDDEQRMFICDEYESANGHRYFKGIRFCENIVIIEKVGLYHTWTYIDSIEIYAFNGEKPELVQKKDYDKVFRNEEFVRTESIRMVAGYLKGVLKLQGNTVVSETQVEAHATQAVERSYASFLNSDYNMCLMKLLPVLEEEE